MSAKDMEKNIQKICQNHPKINHKSETAQDTVRDTVQTSDIADATYKGGAASGRTVFVFFYIAFAMSLV